MEINIQFELASGFILNTNRSVFVTGKAGTGKTTLLKHIQKNTAKRTMVVAPTGIAAIQAGGVTMHSLFQLPLGPVVPLGNQSIEDHPFIKQLKVPKARRTLLNELELLIIDEVSMVRADVLDAIDLMLRWVRRNYHLPFGGVQVVYFGDLYQLPPVIKTREWQETLSYFYEGGFVFNSHVFKQQPPLIIELEKIYRQTDKVFIALLNRIRQNEVTLQDLNEINTHYHPGFEPPSDEPYITLTALNAAADKINQQALQRLETPSFTFEGVIEGDFPLHSLPTDQQLTLKEGAQIMFIKNDKGEFRRFYNGQLARIESIVNGKILVKILDNEQEFELEKEQWVNIRYYFDEKTRKIEEEELGSFSQYPVKLAWAITIHKSQGLTFERAIIDAGDAFASGQVYVALSRLISRDGLKLYTKIHRSNISIDSKVVAFHRQALPAEVLEKEFVTARQQYISTRMIRLFDIEGIIVEWEAFVEEARHLVLPDKNAAMLWIVQHERKLLHLHKTGKSFLTQANVRIERWEKETLGWLTGRIQAGVIYFEEKIDELLDDWYTYLETAVTDPFYIKQHAVICQQVYEWKERLKGLGKILQQDSSDLTALQEAVQDLYQEEFADVRLLKYTGRKNAAGSSAKTSIDLYLKGTSVKDIAALRNLKEGTIMQHMIEGIEQGKIAAEYFMKKEKIEMICRSVREAGVEKLKEMKELFGDRFSFEEIKIALAAQRAKQNEL